ncbi:tetratricopeptide repeat protein [Azospirillum argentinense]|uniref:Tetratricopeptide repeat protein n=1 Tax=Azospirillum argentinense TaxID=2970906 RepID=A0ABW8V4S9_9PROT
MATLQEALIMAVDSLQAGQPAQAKHICRQILAVDPENGNALYLQGVAQAQMGRLDEARDSLATAAARAPGNADIHLNLGRVHLLAGRFQEAEHSLRSCLALAPGHGGALIELAKTLSSLGRFDEAAEVALEALQSEPGRSDARAVLSEARREANDPIGAEEHARAGLRTAPGHPQLLCTLGLALFQQSRIGEAVDALTGAVTGDPRNWRAHFNMCRIHLGLGRLAAAWHHLDQGYAAYPDGPFAGRARQFPEPRWAGEPLAGEQLRVWQPYAIGEEILYAGLYGEIAERAERVVIDTTPKLLPLFRRSFPGIDFIPRADPPVTKVAGITRQCSAFDLMRWLRPTEATIPARRRYLAADPSAVADSRRHFDALGAGPKVGISWTSSSTADTGKSLTLEALRPLLGLPGVVFVTLQYGDHEKEIRALRDRHGLVLHPPGDFDPFTDIDGLAGAIAALDAVVSIPNVTAHLADALGVPTVLLTRPFVQNFSLREGRSLWCPNIRPVFRETDDAAAIGRLVDAACARLRDVLNDGAA